MKVVDMVLAVVQLGCDQFPTQEGELSSYNFSQISQAVVREKGRLRKLASHPYAPIG